MLVSIQFLVPPELKDAIGKEADNARMTLSDFVAVSMAKRIKRPELAPQPRRAGRPRKQAVPA